METVKAIVGYPLQIGRRGENKARRVVFDLSSFAKSYGAGTASITVQRPGDNAVYPLKPEQDGDNIIWTVTDIDTAYAGEGKVELVYTVGDVVAKSVTWQTRIAESVGDPGEVPEPVPDWVKDVQGVGAAAQTAASDAADAARRAEDAAQRAELASGSMEIGNGLIWNGKKLEVDTADKAEQDNTKPITSAAVYTEIGNIEALLAAI